jgi:hypothetical protein
MDRYLWTKAGSLERFKTRAMVDFSYVTDESTYETHTEVGCSSKEKGRSYYRQKNLPPGWHI